MCYTIFFLRRSQPVRVQCCHASQPFAFLNRPLPARANGISFSPTYALPQSKRKERRPSPHKAPNVLSTPHSITPQSIAPPPQSHLPETIKYNRKITKNLIHFSALICLPR